MGRLALQWTAAWEATEAHQISARGTSVESPKPCLSLYLLDPDTKPSRFAKAQPLMLFGEVIGCFQTFREG